MTANAGWCRDWQFGRWNAIADQDPRPRVVAVDGQTQVVDIWLE